MSALDKYAARQQKALVSAAFRGDLEAVKQLLADGAVPDDGDYDGRTALQVCVGCGLRAGKLPARSSAQPVLWVAPCGAGEQVEAGAGPRRLHHPPCRWPASAGTWRWWRRCWRRAPPPPGRACWRPATTGTLRSGSCWSKWAPAGGPAVCGCHVSAASMMLRLHMLGHSAACASPGKTAFCPPAPACHAHADTRRPAPGLIAGHPGVDQERLRDRAQAAAGQLRGGHRAAVPRGAPQRRALAAHAAVRGRRRRAGERARCSLPSARLHAWGASPGAGTSPSPCRHACLWSLRPSPGT